MPNGGSCNCNISSASTTSVPVAQSVSIINEYPFAWGLSLKYRFKLLYFCLFGHVKMKNMMDNPAKTVITTERYPSPELRVVENGGEDNNII